MARITVEDCLERIENRFDLVLLASKRARDLSRVEQPAAALVETKNDKPPVIALREIAAGLIDMSYMHVNPEPEQEEDILAKFKSMEPMAPIDSAYHFGEEDEDSEEAASPSSEPQAAASPTSPGEAAGNSGTDRAVRSG